MEEILYLKEVRNEILCTNYFGDNLEKVEKYIIKSFNVNQNILGISLNGKKIYILLSSQVILIFKDISLLKNEIFKELQEKVKLAYLKYYVKRCANSINFHFRKMSDKMSDVPFLPFASLMMAGSIMTFGSATKDDAFGKFNDIVPSEEKIFIAPSEENHGINFNEKYRNATYVSAENNSMLNTDDISALNSETLGIDGYVSNISTTDDLNDENLVICKDTVTGYNLIANNDDFYKGSVYENLVNIMNDYQKTDELNKKIAEYINTNLAGKMWGNPYGQGYDNYKIPEKYKNEIFTLDELFDDASIKFDIPKDILVTISQHECGQGYFLAYKGQNYGGMMGYLNLNNIDVSYLPNGGYDGCDIDTNVALSVYSYASAIRFFYDSFKDIDIGYGFDAWDISAYMVAIGQGDVSNKAIGFKYQDDYTKNGWSQLNICAPQFKALREAYLNGTLGVNDLTLTAENGVITHWTDGEMFTFINGEVASNKINSSSKQKSLSKK